MESALDQDTVEHEVVVVLDGTDVRADEQLCEIQDRRLRILRPGRIGRAEALNTAYRTARGDFIAILDADDEMLPGRLQKQVDYLRKHTKVDAVGGQLEQFGSWGASPWRFTWPIEPDEIDAWLARGRMPIAHPALTMRRAILERAGGYDPSATRGHDLDLLLRSWRPGTLANLSEPVTRYRVDSKFPSLGYWRREQIYRHAVVRRHRAGHDEPLRLSLWDKTSRGVIDTPLWLAHWTRQKVDLRSARDLFGRPPRAHDQRAADDTLVTVDGIPVRASTVEEAAISAVAQAVDGETTESYRFLNAYSFLLARENCEYRQLLTTEGRNYSDGRPLALLLRRLTGRKYAQVRGPAFMRAVASHGRAAGLRHYLLGGTEASIDDLRAALIRDYPGIAIVGATAPPFRPMTGAERDALDCHIRESHPHFVWVGTGTPRQDFEAQRIHRSLAVTTAGVGAAFDFIAGTKAEAPAWVGHLGLEWAFRLCTEPRRLWRRYLVGNAHFIFIAWQEIRRTHPRVTFRA
ncbi:MAG: WecB/TagA/CpsF family glycosyltransferase [Isosphaeraceae bacterium]